MFVLCSYSNYNNLNHQLSPLKKPLVCVSRRIFLSCPKMRQGEEGELIKLLHQHGKVCAVWAQAAPCSVSVCACSHLVDLLCNEVCCFCSCAVSARVQLQLGPFGRASMRLQYHDFSRWSGELVKQPMRGWCHSPNHRWAICVSAYEGMAEETDWLGFELHREVIFSRLFSFFWVRLKKTTQHPLVWFWAFYEWL